MGGACSRVMAMGGACSRVMAMGGACSRVMAMGGACSSGWNMVLAGVSDLCDFPPAWLRVYESSEVVTGLLPILFAQSLIWTYLGRS
jgi:hypothetical protein